LPRADGWTHDGRACLRVDPEIAEAAEIQQHALVADGCRHPVVPARADGDARAGPGRKLHRGHHVADGLRPHDDIRTTLRLAQLPGHAVAPEIVLRVVAGDDVPGNVPGER